MIPHGPGRAELHRTQASFGWHIEHNCTLGDVIGKPSPDESRRHKTPGGEPPGVGNVVQMQKNVFSEFCWVNGADNSS